MNTAYLDCASGISGDMTLGALVDVGVSLSDIQGGIDSLGIPNCSLEAETVTRRGFRATKIHVRYEEAEHKHHHRHLRHIVEMIQQSRLTPSQKELAIRIFTKLGQAEALVHGTTIEKVHFHEVGAVDSICDIVGAAIAWDLLGVERIVCSPIPTGRGFVDIAHGRVSIPAPATAELLKGIPLADSIVESELTTPTGAAIAATVVDQFGPLPPVVVDRIGCGAGDRDFRQQSNLLRIIVGHEVAPVTTEIISVLETNLDDVSGQVIGYCGEQLFAAGALDVFTTPIQMKKNRPAVKITVLCSSSDRSRMEEILFRETNTLGIRHSTVDRRILDRTVHTVSTKWGPVTGKLIERAEGGRRFAPEFDSCRTIAQREGIALSEVFAAARHGFTD